MGMDGGDPPLDSAAQTAVARARAGDERAFQGLVQVHARPLFQLCFRITRDTALAEDAVQEAFYKAWRGLDSYDGRAAFSTWLHRIAVNAALEQLRRNARHRQDVSAPGPDEDDGADFLASLPDDAPDPEARASGVQIGLRIDRQMQRLSPSERAAFVLRHWEGEPLERIAETLGMNTGQCKQAIFRAVRKLRDALETLR